MASMRRDLQPVFDQRGNRDIIAQFVQFIAGEPLFFHISPHGIEFGSQTDTVFHIDDVTVFREAVHKGSCQRLII